MHAAARVNAQLKLLRAGDLDFDEATVLLRLCAQTHLHSEPRCEALEQAWLTAARAVGVVQGLHGAAEHTRPLLAGRHLGTNLQMGKRWD